MLYIFAALWLVFPHPLQQSNAKEEREGNQDSNDNKNGLSPRMTTRKGKDTNKTKT